MNVTFFPSFQREIQGTLLTAHSSLDVTLLLGLLKGLLQVPFLPGFLLIVYRRSSCSRMSLGPGPITLERQPGWGEGEGRSWQWKLLLFFTDTVCPS